MIKTTMCYNIINTNVFTVFIDNFSKLEISFFLIKIKTMNDTDISYCLDNSAYVLWAFLRPNRIPPAKE